MQKVKVIITLYDKHIARAVERKSGPGVSDPRSPPFVPYLVYLSNTKCPIENSEINAINHF